MKTLGLIGGMAWESTLEYYRLFNEEIQDRLGGWHSAPLILHSVEFSPLLDLVKANKWDKIKQQLGKIAESLEKAGAQGVMICSNTMHLVADDVQLKLTIPLLNIIDATAKAIKSKKFSKVALLGTQYTMEQGFYSERLRVKEKITTLLPNPEQRTQINSIIFNEITKGLFKKESTQFLVDIATELHAQGAEAVVLACTELPLLLTEESLNLPVIDTLRVHIQEGIEFMLEK